MRDLPLSNGRMLVNFDSRYTLSDIYYPHVGKENHSFQGHSRLGVWADGQFAWLDEPGWERSAQYASDTLVTNVRARHDGLGIVLTIEDAVDVERDVLLRRFTVTSVAERALDVRLLLHFDLALGGNTVGDTAFFHPDYRAVVAYKNVHYLLFSGATSRGTGLDGWSTARKSHPRREWLGPDGHPDGTPIAFGSVDFVGELRLGEVSATQPTVAHAWLAAGGSLEEVGAVHDYVVAHQPDTLIERTRNYWRAWVRREGQPRPRLDQLPEAIQALYRRSLLIVRAQTDSNGAIIAAPDSGISGTDGGLDGLRQPLHDAFSGHEDYSYAWPRDGALVSIALDQAGHIDISRFFLAFCARNAVYWHDREHAYMLQKYAANDTVASNVIGWIDEQGKARLPIQEDETALVLIAMRQHYEHAHDWEFMALLHRPLMIAMANFLVDFRDTSTGLPLPSQDLWEERQGVHAFTLATVWRALRDAAYFAGLFNETALVERYLQAADEIQRGTERHLFDVATGRFARSLYPRADGSLERETTIDASLFALAYFGMFDADDPRIVATMDAVASALAVPGEFGGIARYEGDAYQLHQSGRDQGVVGNPWLLCTLWLAQYQILRAKTAAQLEGPLGTLLRVARGALPSGALPEQIDPVSGEPAGATPLTWAHGTFILTVLEYIKASARLAADAPPEADGAGRSAWRASGPDR